MNMKVTNIKKKKYVNYSYYRIRYLINYLHSLIDVYGNLPENYIDRLFKRVNKKHLEREKCNNFILEHM